MLDYGIYTESSWIPPEINPAEIVKQHISNLDEKSLAKYNNGDSEWLIVFKITPYIDSLYVRLDASDNFTIKKSRRFIFKEDYMWRYRDEKFFMRKCVKNEDCHYSFSVMDDIFVMYSEAHPEWHLKRYYMKSMRMLDHIYNCIRKNSTKEILYKAGLDELAVNISKMDEINLLAVKPSDIYEGLSMRTIRALNCCDGVELLSKHAYRVFLLDLQTKFPDLFKESLNDAQCRYIKKLIDGDLTVGEVGRLFMARRKDLKMIWCHTQYEMFLKKELEKDQMRMVIEDLGRIDPLYSKYLHVPDSKYLKHDNTIQTLKYYLLSKREEYDLLIRRSNRKRDYSWQERNMGYVVRYPQTINDFCRESIYMSNCLLTYVDALVNNDTTVLFMRKCDAVNDPYITIEIFRGVLMQAYHRFNEDCTEKEAEWIREYCIRHGIDLGNFKFDVNVDLLF